MNRKAWIVSTSLRLSLFGLICSLLAGLSSARAAFQLIENFQQLPPGALNGQRGWTAALTQVKTDPAQSGNQVASFEAGAGSAYLPVSIPEGTTATLFFRAYSVEDTSGVDWFVGLSDVAISGPGAFGDFETQVGVAGAQSLDKLKIRDGGGGNADSEEFLAKTWYKIWVVIDNAADQYEVYMQGGALAQQTQVDRDSNGNTSFVFRNSAAGPVANNLIRLFALSSTAHLSAMLLDDVYLASGKDLTDPVPLANVPPTIAITAPAPGATFTAPANITVTADASDTDGAISKVEFFQGTTLIGTATTRPYNIVWTNAAAGFYSLTAKATDNLGGTRVSGAVSITLNPAGTNNFVLLDAFESATLANLGGQNGWIATNATVIVDPTQSNNKVASFTGPGGAGLPAFLPEGRTGTLFFRAYSVSDTTAVDWAAGLSDVATVGPGRPYSDYEAQIVVAGAQSLDMLKVRDGTAGANVDLEEFKPRTWYKIWMVADNAIDQTEVYMQGGQLAEPTKLVWDEFGYSSFVFRNSAVAPAANDIVRFLLLTATGHTGQFLLDDVYWDPFGKNLTDPAKALNVLPTAAITAPSNGAIFTSPANITITADASRTGGTISKVEFFAGTNLIGADTASPYSIVWSNAPAGAHALTAKATDNQGASQVSAAVSITVNQGAAQLRIIEAKPDLASGNITLRWEGEGPQFQVEKAATVTGPFQPVGVTQTERAFTDPGALKTIAQSFYRVRQVSGAPRDCKTATAGAGFVNTPFPDQTGTFTVRFEATPAAAPIDSVIGLSSGSRTAFSGFAVLARFNPSGNIDARNGGAYAAVNVIPYSANLKYQFRLVINIPAHTYSIYVTPEGGAEQTVGTDYAFRTEQNTVTNLNNWAVTVASTSGSTTVCDLRVP